MSVIKRVTRDDVAREAGVSAAIVSYVVNNGPRPVSPHTRQKVLDAIDKLGYKPDAVARSLRLKKAFILGLILPDTHNPYFAEVIRGVERVAFERGFSLMLCHSDYSPEREAHFVHILHAEHVAGVLWFPAAQVSEPCRLLNEYGIPFVVLDRTVPGFQCISVLADNFRGGYLATQHLIELGHRRIGCITRPQALSHSQERARGYRSAHNDYDILLDEALIVDGGYLISDGFRAAIQLFQLNPPPTAIFAYNDLMAIGALRAAHEHGLHVPQDLSIVGFDDIPQAAYTCPALTTVHQPKWEMGHLGAELIIDMALNRQNTAQYDQPLPVELIVRESSAVAPNSSTLQSIIRHETEGNLTN